jgi:hypothetical protein
MTPSAAAAKLDARNIPELGISDIPLTECIPFRVFSSKRPNRSLLALTGSDS